MRGGDWQIEGNQSIFYFKVKVLNNSAFVITQIQILLTSLPKGLEVESDRYKIYGRKRLITERNFEIPFRFIDREKYDNHLLQKAQQAGASLVEGDGVKAIDILKNSIKTLRGWNFTADVIIGADGVNSRVRRSFPVDLFGRVDWTVHQCYILFHSRAPSLLRIALPIISNIKIREKFHSTKLF